MGSKSAKQVTYQEPEPVHRVSQEDKKLRDDAQSQAAAAFGAQGTDVTKSGSLGSGDAGASQKQGKSKTLGGGQVG